MSETEVPPNSGGLIGLQPTPLAPQPDSGQDGRMGRRRVRRTGSGEDGKLPVPVIPAATPAPILPTPPPIEQDTVGGMSVRDILVGVVFVLLVGLGVALATSAHDAFEFWVARACFIGAALGIAVAFYIWTKEKRRSRSSILSVGALVAFIVSVLLPISMVWINYREVERPENTQAKIVVTKFIMGQPINNTPNAPHLINVYYANEGNIPANEPTFVYSADVVLKPNTVEVVDNAFGLLLDKIKMAPTHFPGGGQIDTGPEKFFTLDQFIPVGAANQIYSHRAALYLYVVFVYTDKYSKSNEYWISEYCGTVSGNMSFVVNCPIHNRIYVHKY